MGRIINKVWENAQKMERRSHTLPFKKGYEMYKNSYRQYFEFLKIDIDLKRKSIIEIGPADYPALEYCENYSQSFVIEPMPSSHLANLIEDKPIKLITEKAEGFKFPECDEVWFMNVLQHVQDPVKIINNAKKSAKLIRFFEPINYSTDKMHLHEFNLAWFKSHFGDCVKHYPKNNKAVNFHTWECAYGIYKGLINI